MPTKANAHRAKAAAKQTNAAARPPARLCACGCGEPLPSTAGAKTRLKRGHIRRLEGMVGRAIVNGEALTIYGESVDPVELVRSGAVKDSQLPLAAREILTRGVFAPKGTNGYGPMNAAESKFSVNKSARAKGGSSGRMFGAIPAQAVNDLVEYASSELDHAEALADRGVIASDLAEGQRRAWVDVLRWLSRNVPEIDATDG